MKPNNIFCLPKHKFEQRFNQLTEEQKEISAFISINDTFEFVRPNKSNYLNLSFDDADEEIVWGTCVLFNEEHAQSIKRFVESNIDKKYWFIHCTMGQSRSGGVGDVLSEYFGIDYFDFKRDNPQVKPNTLVKTTLRKILLNI